MAESGRVETCQCGERLKKEVTIPKIIGTRDAFGIGKEFKDDKTGKVIDNYRSWEKAGYCNAEDSPNLPASVKNAVKRKIEKIEKYDSGKRTSVMMSKP